MQEETAAIAGAPASIATQWLALATALLCAGCISSPALLPVIETAPYEGSIQQVIVVTSRARVEEPLLRYGDGRSDTLWVDEIAVWVPQARKAGAVAYPSSPPSPNREFAVARSQQIEFSDFQTTLSRRVGAAPEGQKLIFIFVHGYNVPYANGVYRHAQLMEDFDANGIAVHYSWPSSGRLLGYLHDRDSVQFARDGLVEVIEAAAASGAESVFLMGHSMGTLLVMESLRQLSIAGRGETIARVSPLILASPDIDIDVFRSQLNALSVRPDPIVVFVSQADGVLKLSDRIRGGHARVGEGSNIGALQENGIVVIDLTEFDVGEGTNHAAFASSPALIHALRQVNAAQATLSSADRENDRMAPLISLRELTKGVVHLPVGARRKADDSQ